MTADFYKKWWKMAFRSNLTTDSRRLKTPVTGKEVDVKTAGQLIPRLRWAILDHDSPNWPELPGHQARLTTCLIPGKISLSDIPEWPNQDPNVDSPYWLPGIQRQKCQCIRSAWGFRWLSVNSVGIIQNPCWYFACFPLVWQISPRLSSPLTPGKISRRFPNVQVRQQNRQIFLG